jgi:enoyl-CoA hydratase
MTSGTSETLKVAQEGSVLTITLNRPEKLNSVNQELHEALAGVWSSIRTSDAAVIILTGAGRAFCAGGDVAEFGDIMQGAAHRREMVASARQMIVDMLRCPVPIVAAVNGPAIGLGCSLALLSDAVVMAEGAFLADTHVRFGLVPGDGGFLWPLLTGMMQAKLPLLLGDRIDAAEAYRLGLATKVCPPEELARETKDIADRLAALPRGAVQYTKQMLNLHMERSISGIMDFAMAAESLNFIEREEDDPNEAGKGSS